VALRRGALLLPFVVVVVVEGGGWMDEDLE